MLCSSRFLITGIAIACCGTAAFGQTRTFIGPAGGDWFTPGHWSPGSLPNASRDALFLDGRSASVGGPGALARRIDLGDDVTTGSLSVGPGGSGASARLWVNKGSTFTVSGTNAVWNNTAELAVQGIGAAVTVSSGGRLTTTPEFNNFIDYSGSVTVTGNGSRWDSPGILTVYTGTINVLNGATATAGYLEMSFFDDNVAALNVSGGSQLTVEDLLVGYIGSASVNLETGGTLTVTSGNPVYVDANTSINIGMGGVPGILNAAGVNFVGQTGTPALNFNHTGNVTFSAPIFGNGVVTQTGSGISTLSAMNDYTGTTTISGGTLNITGSASSSPFLVESGGTLSGTGITGPVTLDPGGILAPGISPGVLTIGSGSLLDGTTAMEIGGLTRGTHYDGIDVSGPGALTLGGILDISLINAFTPAAGHTFHLFDAGTIIGTFDQYDLPALPAGLDWNVSNLATAGNLSVIAVPEPSSAGLVITVLGLRVRRRRNAAG